MVNQLDILPGAAFVLVWGGLFRLFWHARLRWKQWLDDPANDPAVAIDQRKRGTLRKIFRKYEDERQLISAHSLQTSIAEYDFGDEPLEPKETRKRVLGFVRQFDEALQENVGGKVADAYAATGRSMFGIEIEEFERTRKFSDALRRQRRTGEFLVYASLLILPTAFLSGIAFALLVSLGMDGTIAIFSLPLRATLLVLAWVSLGVAVITCSFLFEIGLRSQRKSVPVEGKKPESQEETAGDEPPETVPPILPEG